MKTIILATLGLLLGTVLLGTSASADPRVCVTRDSNGVYHNCAGVENYYCTAYYQDTWPTGWPVVALACINNPGWGPQTAACAESGSIGSYGCVRLGGVGRGQCAVDVIVASPVNPNWTPLVCLP